MSKAAKNFNLLATS